jgi:hypothetical protein
MNEDQDRIENLKKRLNSISDAPAHSSRPKLHKHASMVNDSWADEDAGETINPPVVQMDSIVSPDIRQDRIIEGARYAQGQQLKEKHSKDNRGKFLKRLFAISFFALVAAVLFFWYVYASGHNYISGANIDINAIGPVSTPSGEVLTLDIDVYNRNASDLESVDLVVQYPDGTRKAEDGVTTVLSDRLPIGTIKQGETVRRRVQVILFGEENIKKDFKFTVQYRVPGSIILFNKEKTYPMYIGSAPIAIDVSTFKEVSPNQTTSFKAIITSNSQNVIRNLVFNASYPAGFSYEKSIPEASYGNNVWTIGDMKPGDKREIEIFGKIVGDADVERYFTFSAGTEDPTDKSRIATRLVETKEKVQVKKPFLSADVSLDKVGTPIYVTTAGDSVQGEIVWQNNLTVPLYDVVIEATLGGVTLDKASVNAERGFYSSINNKITWDRSTVDEMAELPPGVSGLLQFSFASLPPTIRNNSTFRRQTLTLDISVKAKRLSESQVPEEIKSTTSRTVRIASGLNLSSKILHTIGPFENTGPIPPVAEVKTTYTVMNSVSNSFNNVRNVTYVATLPSYVTWLGKVYPESAAANIKYNADKREITWSLGDIAPGTGFNSSAKEFAFQLELLPSVSQVGGAPVLVNSQRIAGTDVFTETIVESISPALDTRMEGDPGFLFGFEKVVR